MAVVVGSRISSYWFDETCVVCVCRLYWTCVDGIKLV